jgi:chromosome partitioning protein
MRVITVCNRKGGVGKTSTAASLAALLSARGARVLCLDTDGQPYNLSTIAGADKSRAGMWELLTEESPTAQSVRACIQPTESMGDMVAAERSLECVDSALDRVFCKEQVMASALGLVDADYDYAVVDTPPGLGNRTLAALVAADDVLVPTSATADCTGAVFEVLGTLAKIRSRMGAAARREISVAGVLVLDWLQNRETQSRDSQLRRLCADQGAGVFAARVRHTVSVPKAHGGCQPVVLADPGCTASRDYAAALAEYLALPGRDWTSPDFRGAARAMW